MLRSLGLAGDLSRSLVDTFGDQHKSFRYYVEPTGNPKDRRSTDTSSSRGWSWVEYGRETADGPRFFTLLLFAEAKRSSTDLNKIWATAEGEQRVRAGIELRLGNAVKPPADVVGIEPAHNGTQYKERLATRLWGFRGADRLDAVVRILKVLRVPNLGQPLDPDFFVRMMRDALPEIDRAETDQLAEGWDQLDKLAADRDEAQAALDAVRHFVRVAWNPWADTVIRLYADALASTTTRFDNVTRDERLARSALTEAERAAAGLGIELVQVSDAASDAETRYEEHLKSPQYQAAAGAVVEADRLRAAAELAGRAEGRTGAALTSARTQRDRRVDDHNRAVDMHQGAVDAARRSADGLTAAASGGGFPDELPDWRCTTTWLDSTPPYASVGRP